MMLTGTTVYHPMYASLGWTWAWLRTDAEIVQMLMRSPEVEARDGLPPGTGLRVKGEWRDRLVPKWRAEDADQFFVVATIEATSPPPPGPETWTGERGPR